MSLTDAVKPAGADGLGQAIYELIVELYPICRSITGKGFRKTMEILRRHIPLEIREVPSGTRVFDWTVPREWNIRDAYVRDPGGAKIIDFKVSNLHVVSYSRPIHRTVSLEELKAHLHTLPEHPDWIPYRTSYYRDDWGFCLSHRQFLALGKGNYEVVIDSTLEDGFLTYGELYLEGETKEEILVTAHACHPSLANDNLSGISVATMLAKRATASRRRHSRRFLFLPGTIGAITWLCFNETAAARIRGGLVITGVGDRGDVTYKKSRRGDAVIDKAAKHFFKHDAPGGRILEFSPYGYDERQFCSPGFDLPVGRFSRTPYAEYPEYHTSADDLSFVSPESLANSHDLILAILDVLDQDCRYLSRNPKCEPQLGARGLYTGPGEREIALLWVLNMSDGSHGLLDIAERSGLRFSAVQDAALTLSRAGLLVEGAE